MSNEEYEKAFLEQWGYPAWSQFLREGKQAGKTERTISDEYSEIKVAHLISVGGRPNKAK